MDRYYVPDCYLDPPEDTRKVVARCEECDEEILEYQEVLHSEYLDCNYCDMNCLEKSIGLSKKYYESY